MPVVGRLAVQCLGATTIKRYVNFTSDMAIPDLYEVECEVEETGVRIIAPKTVAKPQLIAPLMSQLTFCGYYGRFHTIDSGEKEVEIKVFDENGNAVEFLPGVVLKSLPDEFRAKWVLKEDPEMPREDNWDGTEPILYFVESFMPGNSNEKIAEYTDRIRDDGENYEAYIGRAFTWMTSLSESNSVVLVIEKFGFAIDDEHGMIDHLFAWSSFDFGEKLQNETHIDNACEIAVPALKNAIADFAMVPEDWAGAVDFTYQPDMKHPADVTVSFGYADTLIARALCCEMISALYLMKGYNTVNADGTTKDIDLEALKEAQRWMRSAAEMVNAFVPAEADRPDPFRNYFFNLLIPADEFLRQNAQNFLDVPYWTVRFNFSHLPSLLFLNGEETPLKRAKRNALLEHRELDMTLRNVFEGKLSREAGTFPVLTRGFQQLDESVTDPTFAGTFPGMSRTTLAEILCPLTDEKVLETLPDDPYEEIAHYGIFYDLPEGAVNNPGNPATFASNPEYEIRLLNPTMEGYDFLEWTHGGVIDVGTEEMMEFRAIFVKSLSGDIDVPPWEELPVPVGENATAAVKDGICTISGEGLVTGFPSLLDCGSISNVVVESGITEIGDAVFSNCPTGKGAEILFRNPAAVINVRAFMSNDGSTTNVPAVKVETVAKDGRVRRVVPVGFRDVADRRRVYPTLQTAIDAAASAVTPRIRSDVIIVFR